MNYAFVELAHGRFPCVVLHETATERIVETLRGSKLTVPRAAVETADEAYAAFAELNQLRAALDVASAVTPPAAPRLDASQPVATLAESGAPAPSPEAAIPQAADTVTGPGAVTPAP